MKELLRRKELYYIIPLFFLIWFTFYFAKKIRNNRGRICPVDKSQLKNKDYHAIALKLKNSLTGFNVSGRTTVLNSLIEDFNDDEFKEIYNNFNKLLTPSTETLRNWINDEFLPFTSIDEEVIKRIDRLHCA